ncbi:MAG: hypothetical protein GY786_12995 [Proteobacteria bacterium]|nr:hypothetical protein [Pseudomonadota bacterium]
MILDSNFTIKLLKNKVVSAFQVADEVMRGKAVETIEYEAGELDNIFALLVLGVFIGIPSPPIHISMELLPEMEKEFETMLEKVSTAHDPLGDLFSVLDID